MSITCRSPPVGLSSTSQWSTKTAARSLVVGDDDPWQTPAEASDLRRTPSYDETFEWLHRLSAATPMIHMTSIGHSYEGR